MLDETNKGYLVYDDFMQVPALKSNPVFSQIFKYFDTDKSGKINFIRFVEGLARFSNGGTIVDK